MKKLLFSIMLIVVLMLGDNNVLAKKNEMSVKAMCYDYHTLFFILKGQNYVKSMTAFYDTPLPDDYKIIEMWFKSNHKQYDGDKRNANILRRDMLIAIKYIENKKIKGCLIVQGYDVKMHDLTKLFGKQNKI